MNVKAVLLYAQSARFAGGESNYTFAVWDGEQLVPFTKAFEGLTVEEHKEIYKFVRKNTRERFGPVRSVSPELVFEIKFEEINKSARHKCGVVLSDPTIEAWRKDLTIDDINSLADLKSFLINNDE